METPLSGNPKTGRKPLLIPYHVTMRRRMMNCPAVWGHAAGGGCPKGLLPFGPACFDQVFWFFFCKGEEER